MSHSNNDPTGTMSLEADLSSFNAHAYVINQFLLKTRTATLVQIESVTNDGGLSPVGYVDVKVLVQRVDARGNLNSSRTVYNVPYLRLQGGTNAVILDPCAGDIGLACIADRDISVVKASKAESPPGSGRHHDLADAVYLGGILNGTPIQYIQFTDGGITVLSPSNVTLEAPLINLTGNVSVSTGATGSFTTPTGNVVTVQDGIITNIY